MRLTLNSALPPLTCRLTPGDLCCLFAAVHFPCTAIPLNSIALDFQSLLRNAKSTRYSAIHCPLSSRLRIAVSCQFAALPGCSNPCHIMSVPSLCVAMLDSSSPQPCSTIRLYPGSAPSCARPRCASPSQVTSAINRPLPELRHWPRPRSWPYSNHSLTAASYSSDRSETSNSMVAPSAISSDIARATRSPCMV